VGREERKRNGRLELKIKIWKSVAVVRQEVVAAVRESLLAGEYHEETNAEGLYAH